MAIIVPSVLMVLGVGWVVLLVRRRTARSHVRGLSGVELHDITPSNTWWHKQG
jgi:hypothetical protein